MSSIRRALLLSLTGVLSLLIALAALFSYHAGLQEAGEMFDARLVQSARVLLSLVDDPLGDLSEHPGDPIVLHGWHGRAEGVGEALAFTDGHAYETKLAFQVWSPKGQLLLRSDSAPLARLAPLRAGYTDATVDGMTWRVFTLRSTQGRWFQSAERSDIRAELAEDIAMGTLLPLLLALPLMAVLIWLVVSWATRSLVRVSDQIGQRDPERMSPLEFANLPAEVHGLVRAVNGLLQRLDAALARERRFIADAAHELRTPISALKVHAANLRQARGDQERSESQQHLDGSVSRVERLVAQLLALSRADQSLRVVPALPLDLDALVRVEVEELRPLSHARQQTLTTTLAGAQVRGDEHALALLIRSLLENAVYYTPRAGRIAVSTHASADAVEIVIADSGTGIPEEARERVFLRFHRELGSGVEGSGLGLAIAKEVASAHGGRIVLEQSRELGGLEVRVVLPTQA
ncbi:sensor histidine kinase [Xanthomonas maliensis]|uniref:sensor histidine kinase n=1 Tax=Xanthomonas maliensis TaxID=1321368 RepID=UPI0003A2E93F|nr:ATP-binding protein [Xanthomonas maliensis]KAB7767059.1 two-component sensor histidine kinase [Xanthomonas maliensis]